MNSIKQAREMLAQATLPRIYSGGEYRAVIRELVGDLELAYETIRLLTQQQARGGSAYANGNVGAEQSDQEPAK